MTGMGLSYRLVLAAPVVRALLLATLLSRLAGRMFALAIVLYALARSGSPVFAGWVAFSAMAPGLAISPIAGALIDRLGSVWAITVDMAASAACVAALIAGDVGGLASPMVVLVLTGLFSLTSPLSMAGIRALLPRLVPVSALDRVNALDTAINGLTDVLGPASAGAIVGFMGSVAAFVVIVVIYIAAAASIAAIHQPADVVRSSQPLLAEAWSGLLRVVRQPTLRWLAMTYALYEVAWGILIVVVPVFAAVRFGAGAGATIAGLLWAGLGLAAAVAALVAGHRSTAGRERKVMVLGLLASALAAWPVAAEFGLPGLVVGLLLVGTAAGPIDVGVLTLRQRRTDPAELGRVLSVSMSLNLSGGPIGSALAGVLAAWSVSVSFVAAGLACVLAAAAAHLIPAQSDRVIRTPVPPAP
jgi:MFS family permease